MHLGNACAVVHVGRSEDICWRQFYHVEPRDL